MKFVHAAFEHQIVFEENTVNVLVLENQNLFCNIISSLDNQIKTGVGSFTVSKELDVIDISKTWTMIINPLDFEALQKKVVTKLYAKIKEYSQNEDFFSHTNSLKTTVFEYFEKMFDNFSFPLEYRDDLDMIALCKSIDIKPIIDGESFLERLTSFMSMFSEFLPLETFVFVNLKSYLSEQEIKDFYDFTFYNKLNVLLIESTNRNTLENERKVIIDSDLCEI